MASWKRSDNDVFEVKFVGETGLGWVFTESMHVEFSPVPRLGRKILQGNGNLQKYCNLYKYFNC